MSMTPPPGWYPDPNAPRLERWWDGGAWTEHRRARGADVAPPAPEPNSGRAKAVALIAAGAVLVAAIVIGALLLREDHEDRGGSLHAGAAPTPATSAARSAAPTPATRSAGTPAADDAAVVVDRFAGGTLPGRTADRARSEDNATAASGGAARLDPAG
ncbi:DUF2510 domain-containing protein [Streptomyces sp. NPDC056161]|uniref:DUF2510 domain-containing protein n=1 Tax=Streptomyces sp. NPDC056161 TaxID=3345732 RepID=UPI0035DD06DE